MVCGSSLVEIPGKLHQLQAVKFLIAYMNDTTDLDSRVGTM
jgi:hypothetical protein